MKKFLLTAMCLVMTVLPTHAMAADQQYSVYSSIGFGPLEGELTSPKAMGTDENGRIYVIDAASRKGLVFQSNGTYFKSIAIPESVQVEKLCPNISVYMGMVAYPDGNVVHLASSTGEVSTVFGLGTKLISESLKVKLLEDYSLLVLDRTNGILKFDKDGNFMGQVVVPGKLASVPNILSFDISSKNECVVLSMSLEEPKNEEGAPEPNTNSIVQITILDSSFKLKNTFSAKTDETYSPLHGQINWLGDSSIVMMSTDASGFITFDANGNVLSEAMKGGITQLKTFTPAKDKYYSFTNTEFVSISKDGTMSVLAKFDKESMKFGSLDQISVCGDGIAVYDKSRKDIQFFSKQGFSGIKTYDQAPDIVLFTDASSRTCVYNNTNRSAKVFSCDGNQISAFEFEPQVGELSKISKGSGEELIGISQNLGNVVRISKDGFLIGKIGSSGVGENQYKEPVDAFFGPDKNFYVLDRVGVIKVYDSKNEFVRQITMPSDKTKLLDPSDMLLLPSGEIMISDSGNDRLVVFNFDGSYSYAIGSTSPAMAKTKKGDYFANLGTFVKPGEMVVNGDSVYAIDKGNLRIQVLRKEKVAPKISVDKQSLDFGKVVEGVKVETITIKNTGTGILEGSAVCDSNWVELPKKTFTGNAIKLEVRLLADKVPYWNEKSAEIVINSNGGMVKVSIDASKPGKIVKLQIDSSKAYVDGIETKLQVAPMLVGGNTMVPLRFIGEVLGATVDWDATEKKVTYTLGKQIVVIWIGKKEALVNSASMAMTAAPVIVSGKTLVPLRFIGEALGASVEWIASSKTIMIYYPPKK